MSQSADEQHFELMLEWAMNVHDSWWEEFQQLLFILF